jgi:regulatory protein
MIQGKTENEKAYHQALKYLKYRPRSRNELCKYLKGKNFSDKSIVETIQRLESAGFINDLEFARLWVENRRRFKPKGRYVLKIELNKKGIADEIIDSVLKSDDEEKNASAAIQPKMLRWQHLDSQELRKKVFVFLRSRGFKYQTCLDVSDRMCDKAAITKD